LEEEVDFIAFCSIGGVYVESASKAIFHCELRTNAGQRFNGRQHSSPNIKTEMSDGPH
jgi:hypothetical protein